MSTDGFPRSLSGLPVHLVGIKGTGMSALAEILKRKGSIVSGSDTEEQFYTDEVLRSCGIGFAEGFRAENVPAEARLVIYSTAYNPEHHPELIEATRRRLPTFTYDEALGGISETIPSNAVSGTHGKTTTTAMVGTIVKALNLPGTVLAGSAVGGFGGKSTLWLGDQFFVAETCEYRRHFLNFSPANAVITSVEPDHLDYFRDYADVLDAFVEFGRRIAPDGCLIYCADDAGAVEAARRIAENRGDIVLIPYGERVGRDGKSGRSNGLFSIESVSQRPGRSLFRIAGCEVEFSLRIPGRHSVLNAVAALALVTRICASSSGTAPADQLSNIAGTAAAALDAFTGSRRRSEIIGEVGGILVMDDYGHHPTEIAKTLAGLREFYPDRRIVCDFMSHTYSRTESLLDEFSVCFESADIVLLHRIYASAREKVGRVSGRDLATAVSRHHSRVLYFDEIEEALPWAAAELRPGDLFITMGAGNNWRLGRMVYGMLIERYGTESAG